MYMSTSKNLLDLLGKLSQHQMQVYHLKSTLKRLFNFKKMPKSLNHESSMSNQ